MKVFRIFFTPLRNSLAAFSLFVFLWTALSLFFESYILPSPLEVLRDRAEFWDSAFPSHLKATLGRAGAGFFLSFLLGTVIGILSYLLRIHVCMETVMALFQVVPGLILGIVFLLVFGVGSAAPAALIVFLTAPLIAINTAGGLLKRNRFLEEMIRSFNGTAFHLVRDLWVPALVPTLRANAASGAAMALKIVLLGEYIASENGIGRLLNEAGVYFNMAAVFFYLLVILLLILFFQIAVSGVFALCFEKYLYPG